MDPAMMNTDAYKQLPADSPPPGVTSNFQHPISRAYGARVGMGVSLALASIFMLLRIFVRGRITRTWSWEDSTCLLAYAILIAFDGVFFFLIRTNGIFARHVWDIPLGKLTKTNLQALISTINLYMAAAFLVKLSLFLFYLRLFKPFKATRWLIYIGLVACGLFYFAVIISTSILCTPLPGTPKDDIGWDFRFYQCVHPMLRVSLVQAVFSMVSDIYIIIIPVYSIFRLQLPLERKVGVSATFLVGIAAIACSIGSVICRSHVNTVEDETWGATSVYIFSSAELSAGIICSCLPILSPLYRKHMFFSLASFSWRRLLSRRSSEVGTPEPRDSSTPNVFRPLHLGWTKKGGETTIDESRVDSATWEKWSDKSIQEPERGHQDMC